MATDTDLQRLVVQMSADFRAYERSWNKALGVTDANVKRVQSSFTGLSRTTSQALAPVGFQTANIAAQFQDIAVQLQGGGNWLTVALQQGTQLSQALGSSGGLKGALKGVAGGLASLVSPVSLVTIGFIALGGAAVQYFTSLIADGKASEEELKKQEDLIRKVADRWGDAAPALKAYVAQLDNAQAAAEGKDAEAILVAKAWDGARTAVTDFNSYVTDAISQMQAAGAEASTIDALQSAWNDFTARVRTGTATQEDANRVSAALSRALETVQLPLLGKLQSAWGLVAAQIAAATRNADTFKGVGNQVERSAQATADFVAEQERLNGLTTEQLALETEINRLRSDAERKGAAPTEEKLLELAKETLAAEQARAQAKAGAKADARAETEAQRQAKAILEVIAALDFEYEQLSKTARQQAIANELRRAGAEATSAEGLAIAEKAGKLYDEQQRVSALSDLYDELGQAGKSAITGIVDALADGKVEANELGSILSNLLGQFGNFFLNQAFSGGGGNIFSALFGGPRVGRNADGTNNWRGGPTLVGERGPELVNLPKGAQVIPAMRTRQMLGDQNRTFAPVININGSGLNEAQLTSAITAAFSRYRRFEFHDDFRRHAADPLARG